MSKAKPKLEDELPTFYVPKKIYDKAFDELEQKSVEVIPGKITMAAHCHKTAYRYFNTKEPALCNFNIMEAARQAFEDRNFRVLYEIIDKGMDIRDNHLTVQLFEYLYAAIELDPKITNREEMLINTVKGFKVLDNDEEAKKIIENAHKLIKMTSDSDDSFEEEIEV